MMTSNPVVDINVDPLDAVRRRRRALLRIGVPIGGVALMIGAILLIALHSYRANRDGALALSNHLLATLEQRIATEISGYLAPASRAVRILRDTLRNGAFGNRLPLAETVSDSLLREIPQIANLYAADEDGNFVLVRRGEAGGTDVKVIENLPGSRRVTWIHRNSAGEEIGREDDPTDTYDPRTRPWYIGARESDDLFWSEVYIFFTQRVPGITVSARHRDAQGRLRLFGVAPGGLTMAREVNGEPAAPRIDEVGDDVLTHAYDRFRIEATGHRAIEIGGRTYISAVMPITGAGRDWLTLIVAPENDFVGFVEINNRRALLMSLAIVLVAAALALLLVRQGLRADRNARQLLERQSAIARQSNAFSSLASDVSLFDPAHGLPSRTLTETLAEVTGARGASIWRLADSGWILRCEDSFDRETAGHLDGLELHHGELPALFASLSAGDEIEVADVARDRRTAGLGRVLTAFGTKSLLSVAVRRGDQVVGAIWVEDAPRTPGNRDFVRAVANMVAVRLAGSSATPVTRERVVAPDKPPATPQPAPHNFAADLRPAVIDLSAIHAETYTAVAVMVLRFTDDKAVAERFSGEPRCVFDEIARGLQLIAANNGVPYLKLAGHEVIAAAGFGPAEQAAATTIADAALAVRDRCIALFDESGRAHEFQIGIDCSIGIGGAVGNDPRIFNLWGDAVRSAETMAASAPVGTVQATEAAYRQLRRNFLFRPRGSFYLPNIGAAGTFVLAGRL